MSATEADAPDWLDARDLQGVLGYEFEDISLLEMALQHSSFANEASGRQSNERLEFLGDSVLGSVVAHALYEAHPKWQEGDLSLALHNLVDQRSLARLGADLGVGSYLRLGRTERQSSGESKPGIVSDAVEAILGAIYLDGGLAPVEKLLRRVFASALAADAVPVQRDPKTRFQEWVMARTGVFPTYDCVGNSGIEGDENRFTVKAMMGDEAWGEGTARSKRKAEQLAATQALERADREGDE